MPLFVLAFNGSCRFGERIETGNANLWSPSSVYCVENSLQQIPTPPSKTVLNFSIVSSKTLSANEPPTIPLQPQHTPQVQPQMPKTYRLQLLVRIKTPPLTQMQVETYGPLVNQLLLLPLNHPSRPSYPPTPLSQHPTPSLKTHCHSN
jgi:hypothetical protein